MRAGASAICSLGKDANCVSIGAGVVSDSTEPHAVVMVKTKRVRDDSRSALRAEEEQSRYMISLTSRVYVLLIKSVLREHSRIINSKVD